MLTLSHSLIIGSSFHRLEMVLTAGRAPARLATDASFAAFVAAASNPHIVILCDGGRIMARSDEPDTADVTKSGERGGGMTMRAMTVGALGAIAILWSGPLANAAVKGCAIVEKAPDAVLY